MIRRLGRPDSWLAIPGRVLLIDDDPEFAQRVKATVVARAGGRVWLWHERTPELALTLLTPCEFDLIILALPRAPGPAARIVHAVAETALGTPILLVARGGEESSKLDRVPSGVIGTLEKGDVEATWTAMADALGFTYQLTVE